MAQRTIKLKGSNFFSKEKWSTVRLAVESINKIVMKATMLTKVYYLQNFENELIILNESYYDICFKVITNQQLNFRSGMTPEKQLKLNIYNTLKSIYQIYFDNKFIDISNLSISQILGSSCKQLETAMLNNIQFHYIQHVNKYMYTYLYKKFTDQKSIIAKARNYIFNNTECPIELLQWCNENINIIKPIYTEENFNLDFNKRPWHYLKHMVLMNQNLNPSIKLLSPLILRRSYIPKHICIDTNALVQLLIKPSDIEDFVTFYNFEYNEAPNIKTKTDLGKSFKAIFKREPKDEKEDFLYQQSYWKFICNWNSNKFQRVLKDTKRELYFGNSIMTDGCSISFNLVTNLAKKTFQNRKTNKKLKIKDEFLNDIEFNKDTLYLSCDPGKKDIISITDGYNMFKYTKGQKDVDTKRKYFTDKNLSERNKTIIKGEYQFKDYIIPNYFHMVENLSLANYEERVLSKYNSKSCNLEIFLNWIKAKLYEEETFIKAYSKPKYRNDKFTKYCLEKKSEDKMIQNLKEFISNRKVSKMLDTGNSIDQIIKTNISKEYNDIILLYGNWGKNTNMKNNAPTPGINLRRKLHNHIPTYTINEYNTSKTCPWCKEISLNKATVSNCKVSERHHLLRCSNGLCSCRWWNRNVAGAYNILFNGIKELQEAKDSS